jgi:DNA/RNA-binding domain of Phe-tRNA-synthetase-like protein
VEFGHSTRVWNDFPELVPGVLVADGIGAEGAVDSRVASFVARAESRLASCSEGELPDIHAWRRAFARMGFKPTQYRCASEALLRRFRKERALPRIHPLIDLCNAISMAFATPVAVFDGARIVGDLEVRHAGGRELYESFSGETESPAPGEVIFADGAGRAHARRWTNRQSSYSAVRDETTAVLIVAEALHETARADMASLVAAIEAELDGVWSAATRSGLLTSGSPRFALDG